MAYIDYYVLKNYKGLFIKRHRGNTHAFYIPLGDNTVGYFGLLGRVVDETLNDGNDTDEDFRRGKDTYALVLIFKMEIGVVERIQDEEKKFFGDRYIHVESVEGDVQTIQNGYYNFHINKPGKYIHSDVRTKYMVEHSTANRRIYFMYGDFDFEITDLQSKQLRGLAHKTFMNITDKKSKNDSEYSELQHENELVLNEKFNFSDVTDKARYTTMLHKRSEECRKKTELIQDRRKRIYAYNMCQAAIAKKTITELSALVGQCNAANHPERCKERINNQINKWRVLYQEYLVKIAKSRVND